MENNAFYLAGPMRGHRNLNFPLFNRATDALRSFGLHIISPAEQDRVCGEPWTNVNKPDYADENYVFSLEDCRRMFDRDMGIIRKIDPSRGGIILLPGWNSSAGALGEAVMGQWLKLPLAELMVARLPTIKLVTVGRICGVEA